MPPSESSIPWLSILLASAAALIPLRWYWNDLILGQRIYACCLLLIIPLHFCVEAYRHPDDKTIHWGVVWNPPTVKDPLMSDVLTPEVVRQIEGQLSDPEQFVEQSTTRVMPRAYLFSVYWGRRCILLAAFGIAAIGWYIIPDLLERMIYGQLGLGRRHASDR